MAGQGTSGVATAVADALDAREGLPSDAVRDPAQADLWADPQGEGAGPLGEATMEALGAALFGRSSQGRGAGRPKGSQNRQTAEFRRLFLSQHRHPVLVLGDFTSVPVEVLAHRLRTSDLLAVAKFQKDCAVAAAPYIEKRLPLDVAVKHEKGLTLVIGDLTTAAQQAGGPTIDAPFVLAESQPNQRVSATDAGGVGTGPLVSGAESLQYQLVMGDRQGIEHPVEPPNPARSAPIQAGDGPPDRDPRGAPPADDPPV